MTCARLRLRLGLCFAGLTFAAIAASDSTFGVDDMLDVRTLNIGALSDNGRWLAATSGSLRDRIGIDNYRFGDPTYIAPNHQDLLVIDTQSGASRKVFADRRQVTALAWSPDGARLAMLAMSGDGYAPVIWDRATGQPTAVPLPSGKIAAENAELRWSADGARLLINLRPAEWRATAAERFRQETQGMVVFHSSKEPFLAWDDVRRMSLEKSLAAFEVKTGKWTELIANTKLGTYELTEDGAALTYQADITKKTDYDVIFGSDGELRAMPAAGGNSTVLLKSTKGLTLIWSRDGRHYAYTKDGVVMLGGIEGGDAKPVAGTKSPAPDKDKPEEPTEAEKEKRAKERFTAVRLSPKGDFLVASNKEGLWMVDTTSHGRELFVKMPEEDKLAPRYEAVGWNGEGSVLYLSYSSRTRWERGLASYDVRSKKLSDLWKDNRIYSNFRVSKDGHTIVFAAAPGNRPTDLYAVTDEMKAPHRLTTLNPKIEQKQLGNTELVTYLDADGKKLNGVLYYPSDYQPGRKYPTIVLVYEQFFDDVFNSFNSLLTANGYAVLQPSVEFETGFPGESWLKGATAAVNKAIDMGVADPERLGIQGTSYGGYATNLLITQTNRFKAAVNVSGKVDMISFYTDSPRLGVRNIHAPEKSQDRLGATLWQQPQKYLQHSAILYADRIKTPLLLINGEQDHNVPARQGMEMYYALRRLNKEVAWVLYPNGGHGMPTSTVDEVRDYSQRILDWYATYLKKPADAAAAPSTAGQ
jgi:dipeptidyl aminopeptidase/acylaminoacyl peptidase